MSAVKRQITVRMWFIIHNHIASHRDAIDRYLIGYLPTCVKPCMQLCHNPNQKHQFSIIIYHEH